ncbi:MAG: imidazoleglycerol-phosphate dehydratase [Candidatus Wildermuthbacteria bacterium]|nr:imidazoleglycerol-phosphate dehydratase [Candidatus Wildermuthbacteria bacterium]
MTTAHRIGKATRKTLEAEIDVELRLDTPGCEISISSVIGEPGIQVEMARHFLEQLHRFSEIGGKITAEGRDFSHHSIEDMAICWGQALRQALGDKKGIRRTAIHIMPMEGTIVTVALDLSGRPFATLDFRIPGTPMSEMVRHILTDIAMYGLLDLYVKVEYVGDNAIRLEHHALETIGKALGIVLNKAMQVVGAEVPSTKGTL